MNAADVAAQLDSLRQIAAEAQALADLRFHCIQEQASEISRLRAALADREALLREIKADWLEGHSERCLYQSKKPCVCGYDDLLQRIEAALSGTQEEGGCP